MGIFDLMATHVHEEVIFFRDQVSALRVIVAIHNTSLGAAIGGTRMRPYPSEEEALSDVLLLARAMTYKAALAGLDVGGGKAVIIGDPTTDKTEPLLRAYGRFVDSLAGRYVTTTDVGMTTSDMDIIRRETPFVAGGSPVFGGGGDTSVLTSLTVCLGMQAAAKQCYGSESLAGLSVAVQGLGKVGWHLAERLAKEGCRLYVTDVDPRAVERAVQTFSATPVPPDEVYDAPCDIFSPNALGGVLNDATIPRLHCRIVCGGANNPLADPSLADELAKRGILFAPDFAVNCGGLINAAEELTGYDEKRAEARAHATYETTLRVFAAARQWGVNPYQAAVRLAEERIHKISAIRHIYVLSANRRC